MRCCSEHPYVLCTKKSCLERRAKCWSKSDLLRHSSWRISEPKFERHLSASLEDKMSIAMPPSRTKMTPSIRPAGGYVRLPARRRRHYRRGRRRDSMTELENDDEWCLRFIICPRCLCDAIKRLAAGIGIGTWAYGNVRILWLHSVICWAESTFYLSLSMGRWVVNSRVALLCWLDGWVYVRFRFRFEFQVRDLKLSTTLTPEQKRVIILVSSLLLPKLLGELAKIGDIFRKCLSNQKYSEWKFVL